MNRRKWNRVYNAPNSRFLLFREPPQILSIVRLVSVIVDKVWVTVEFDVVVSLDFDREANLEVGSRHIVAELLIDPYPVWWMYDLDATTIDEAIEEAESEYCGRKWGWIPPQRTVRSAEQLSDEECT